MARPVSAEGADAGNVIDPLALLVYRRPSSMETDFEMRRAVGVTTAVVAGWIVATSGPAEAQRRFGGAGELMMACGGDYRRLCQGVPPGGGRILACLNQQADQLSQTCFQALAERGLAAAAAFRLCRPDFERLCPGLIPGMGRGLACLVEQTPRLSPGCYKALEAHGFVADDEAPPSRPIR